MTQYDQFIDEYVTMRRNMFDKGMNPEFPVMLELLGDLRDKRLIDLGCGFGDYTQEYARRGARVVGLDASIEEIRMAKDLCGLDFVVHDLRSGIPFADSEFDCIASSLVLGHIKDLSKLFEECYRVLNPGGIIVFSVTNPVFYQETSLAGKEKKDGRKIIHGNYFERREIVRVWGGTAEMRHYHKPLEDYFSAFLGAGFELFSFREPQAKVEPETWHCRNPTFLVFGLRKKQSCNL